MLTFASLVVFMVFLESQCAHLPTSATVKVFVDSGDDSVRAYRGKLMFQFLNYFLFRYIFIAV